MALTEVKTDAVAAGPGGRTRTVHLRVWRGTAAGGEFRDYTVEVDENAVVLDALHRLQATQVHDLAVRWNCKAGRCGSCSAEVNGRPRLTCMTRLSSLPPDRPVVVAPMKTFPVIKDLVPDVSFNYEVAKTMPVFRPGPKGPDGRYRMTQAEVSRIQEFHKCIECWLCQNVCHVIRDHQENLRHFAGPRFFVRLAALDMHPLDTNPREALARFARERAGVGFCNITKCCTEVCPEDIHITDNAIIPIKERVVDERYDPLLWLWRKVTGAR